MREELQPDNGRKAKPIPESVYLMNHVSCPAVLVECGFLTNPEEEARLRDGGYQRQLAAVLAGVMGFLAQGMTDYSFYNYRVTLVFWAMLGLGAVWARVATEEVPAP